MEGPGKVIGVDGTNILVKHGGYVVKVHRTRLRGVKTAPTAPIPAISARIALRDTGIDAMQHESDQEELGETKILEIVGSSDGEPVWEHSVPTDCSGQEIGGVRITEEQTSKITNNESNPYKSQELVKFLVQNQMSRSKQSTNMIMEMILKDLCWNVLEKRIANTRTDLTLSTRTQNQ